MILKKFILSLIAVFFLALFAVGCTTPVGNNYLNTRHVVEHFQRNRIPITEIAPLRPSLLHAGEGVAVKIGNEKNSEIGIYKFDISNASQQKALERFKKNGYVMVNGLKFQAWVNGSFLMLGAEKNQYREELISSFNTFSKEEE